MSIGKGIGKILALLFWAVVIYSLAVPLLHPFDALLEGLALGVFALHVVELLFFIKRIKSASAILQILLMGVFAVDTPAVERGNA